MTDLRTQLTSLRDELRPRRDEVTFASLEELRRHRRRRQRTSAFVISIMLVVGALSFLLRAFDAPAPVPVTPSSVTPANPAIPTGVTPPHGAVVFDVGPPYPRNRRQSELAFVAPGSAGSMTLMTDAAGAERVAGDAAWSPDGSRIAFVLGHRDSWRFTGDGYLYVMNADGSDLRRLARGIGVTSPTWSADGTQLAFVKDQGSVLCVINADGSDLHVIASARGYYQHPRWSPTDDVIVYQSRVNTSETGVATFTIRSDGTDERLLPRFIGGGSYPSFSPDGTRLVFAHGAGLAIFDLSSGQTQPLLRCAHPRCEAEMFPAWSPDGTAIAFIRDEGSERNLYVLQLSSGRVTRLTSDGMEESAPTWRP